MKSLFIGKDRMIKEAMRQMNQVGEKELFVIEEENKLFGVLSDGDIRKWILSGGKLEEKVLSACNRNPITIGENFAIEEVKKLLLNYKIEAIPVLKGNREIAEVLMWDEVFSGKAVHHREKLDLPVVIMAGGKGTRLDPFTKVLPKALIPIGDKPIIEMIMEKFAEYGIREFYLSINNKSRMIKSYFEELSSKYTIKYVEEQIPLGTAGSLKLLQGKLKGKFIVTNCDVIIDCDYSEILKLHEEKEYDMTLVVSSKRYIIPYGICEIMNGGTLKSITEKPEYDLLVNTGMYILKSELLDLIPKNKYFNINELMLKAQQKDFKVGVFPISERAWIDIGQWDEYRKAVKEFKLD